MRRATSISRPARTAVVALLVASLAGCDLGDVATAPVPLECTGIGERCQMPDGPIGVCQETRCETGVAPPCYVCTPQH